MTNASTPPSAPLVGIVMPLYNNGAHIAGALRALQAQTLADWCAIVVDDGSTDDGPALAREIAAGDSRIRVISQRNAGVSAARNAGLDAFFADPALTPRYLMVHDGDDALLPSALESLVRTAEQAGTAGALGDFRLVRPDGATISTHRSRFARLALNEWLGSAFVVPHIHLVRSDAWRGLRFATDLAFIEDTELWLRMASRGVVWTHTPNDVALYTVRPDSRSTRLAPMLDCSRRVWREAYARARAAPLEGVDASETRLRAVLARAAWTYATRAALTGDDQGAALQLAQELLASEPASEPANADDPRLDAPTIVRIAQRAANFVLAIDPTSDTQTSSSALVSTWRQRCAAWWAVATQRGWLAPGVAAEALAIIGAPADSPAPATHTAAPRANPAAQTLAAPSPLRSPSSPRLRPLVSVVVPMYNSASTIDATLQSVQRQTLDDWELVIVNDGSTDDGPAIASAWARADARVRVVSQPNAGLAGARNTGIDQSRGRFLAFLDADDSLAPTALEDLHRVCEQRQTDASFGGFDLVDADARVLLSQRSNADELTLADHLGMCFVVTHAMLFRREVFARVRFDAARRLVEDTDCWLRLGERGVRWANTRSCVAQYFIRPGSLSQRAGEMLGATREVFISAFARARALRDDPSNAVAPLLRQTDLSPKRLDELLARTACVYATRVALAPDLSPDDALTRAGALLESLAGPKPIAPSFAAGCAVHAVVFALGVHPRDDARRPQWQPRLERWWALMRDRAWCDPSSRAAFVEQTLAALHERLARIPATTASTSEPRPKQGAHA
jgi:glycosyltransferase involved in cell wall biosynthesis